MWLAKTGVRLPIAISGRQRLSGTASNADVASTNYFNDYSVLSHEEVNLNGKDCWILNLEAKNNLVTYPKIKYWVSKEGNFGLKAEFFGKSGRLIKKAEYEYNNKVSYKSKNYNYMSKVTIFDNVNLEDKTVLEISDIKFENFSNAKFLKNNLVE